MARKSSKRKATPLGSYHFVITNWFAWIIEAHKAGMSDSDIRFVLENVGVLDEVRKVLIGSENDTQA